MANVLQRTTKEYRRSVNTPDFSPIIWLVLGKGNQPEIATIEGFIAGGLPTRYIFIELDDSVRVMTPAEKLAVDLTVQTIVLASGAPLDFDGVPFVLADGISTHTITVSKVDLGGLGVPSGVGTIFVDSSSPVARSASDVTLVAGVATLTVGPSTSRGDLDLSGVDPAGVLRPSRPLTIRFK